jgi:hypothetical protein
MQRFLEKIGREGLGVWSEAEVVLFTFHVQRFISGASGPKACAPHTWLLAFVEVSSYIISH